MRRHCQLPSSQRQQLKSGFHIFLTVQEASSFTSSSTNKELSPYLGPSEPKPLPANNEDFNFNPPEDRTFLEARWFRDHFTSQTAWSGVFRPWQMSPF
ncbi:hypothetical protein NPIL_662331 [Nephila pilipes]|uniref:Uncharacterized protein n=1 Tax=Nephila pilipes TaxID=299642 RepID=A0A8X6NKW2_NEPPI|nr:hypothetical protein NPIL_662331 [Nephila pilipes]